VTKNGILIVEFANQRKAAGVAKLEAVKGAAAARFRPILMTSLSTIFVSFPSRWASGPAGRAAFRWVSRSSGDGVSTGLTLYVIPAIYSYSRPRGLAGSVGPMFSCCRTKE